MRTFLPGALALLAIFATTDSLVAQVTQANYPLLTDLDDTTGSYGPMTLTGNTPPAPPNNGVRVNGVYLFAGGQDARTPLITSLDTNDFQLELEFQVAALPAGPRPIFVGGNGWRWIGFYIDASGTLGVLYNNASFTYSSNMITVGTWHAGVIKYEGGVVQ